MMNIKELEELIKLVERSNISELEITKFGGRKVRITKVFSSNQQSPSVQVSTNSVATAPPKIEKKPKEEKKLVSIRSSMVGTFYKAPAPDAPPYVEVGDIVKPGQVVCIVEAMKLMNEIESDVHGKIADILVKSEEPVEFGQELFLVEPL